MYFSQSSNYGHMDITYGSDRILKTICINVVSNESTYACTHWFTLLLWFLLFRCALKSFIHMYMYMCKYRHDY